MDKGLVGRWVTSDLLRWGDVQAEEYPKEEGSEVHTGGRSVSWGARSPRRHRRRQRMVWTPELHERFQNAVNHLVRLVPLWHDKVLSLWSQPSVEGPCRA